MKTILGVYSNPNRHWVGDGFPVRSLFSYNSLGGQVSPFLLLDYAGPWVFDPAKTPRGVGQHPHRGFETVTIVYDGEVAHRDSTGQGGVIGPGDVQWMTAGGGILHEEFHSPHFTAAGGPFRMVQLWVNLPAKDKMTAPGYQSITNADIPVVELPDGAGKARIIAGDFGGATGPARTFTPVNVWDVRLDRDADLTLDLPEGHTAMLVVLSGHITVGGSQPAGEAEMVLLGRDGAGIDVHADGDATMLVLTGEPIDEPIVGYGPFVMNSRAEIEQAIDDFNSGRFGQMAAA
ncbi:pirin family protein [Sphingosinicella sp. LHD-64]|uniref:pirin family protein n=1 Tax=Sphingosinicella sp. LHD-64 TaxID=3072139 RepID=UPI00280D9E87|nr:pirin family protein [Sphingosinicella sp. LHD-64]MDQ8755319.1 pirin family protein [Sphingosinicella sp. LHD-64]